MSSVPHDLPHDLPEVDHSDRHSDLHAVRELIRPIVERLVTAIHLSDVVPPGRQWTIPVGLDCDFDCALVIRVTNQGTCERAPETAPESAIARAVEIGKRGRRR